MKKKTCIFDTNAILYWYFDSKRIKSTINDIKSLKYTVSPFSIWEIGIKTQIGKLKLPFSFQRMVDEIDNCFDIIDFILEDIHSYSRLPLHHRDPFDRMIIAQALTRNSKIVTSDYQFKNYSIDCVFIE